MCGCARQRCAGRAWLRLELIIIVQRSNEERGARKEVRVLREKENGHEGGRDAHVVERSREATDVSL
jgi:hypothetical protein